MKRSTLIVCLIALVAIMAALSVATASMLTKLLRGETFPRHYPGMDATFTRTYDPATNPKLTNEPWGKDVYLNLGDSLIAECTFRTGDSRGRAGQVCLSAPGGKMLPIEPVITKDSQGRSVKPRDHGGMNLLTTFPPDQKHISFGVKFGAGYPSGWYHIFVQNFEGNKTQGYGDIVIPVYVAQDFDTVKEALKDEPEETLRKYGLRKKLLVEKISSAWTGRVVLSDGARLNGVRLPRCPRVGEAIGILDGYIVVGGGVVQAVNDGNISVKMGSQVLRGYERRITQLTAKLAYWSPLRGVKHNLTSEEERWVSTFPEYAGKDGRNRYRAAVRELLELGVIHVGEKLSSTHYWLGEQLATQPQGVWQIVDAPVEFTENVRVFIDRAYGGGTAAIVTVDLVRLGISKPGLMSMGVIWNLNPTRVNTASESNSAAAAAARGEGGDATNHTDIDIGVQQ